MFQGAVVPLGPSHQKRVGVIGKGFLAPASIQQLILQHAVQEESMKQNIRSTINMAQCICQHVRCYVAGMCCYPDLEDLSTASSSGELSYCIQFLFRSVKNKRY